MNIGYIGLGLMGKPCARHLMKAGHTVHIWARNKQKVQDLISEGAVWCDSPAKVAEQVEFLFTNLSDTPDVEAVLLGQNGVIDGGKSGLIVADMSTISAITTREIGKKLAEKGIILVDTPVSGGTKGAQEATLTIMVGAEPDVFEKVKPLLSIMGSKVTLIGALGAGQVAKSCNQIMFTSTLMGVSEAFRLARTLGVDIKNVREALMGGFARSTVLDLHGQRIIEQDFAPGFKIDLHHKDMGIVDGLAKELGLGMPVSALCLQRLDEARQEGDGELDSAAISKIIDRL
ncbi:NAD(P)-dependent oxidoreductase [Desulfovibrio sp. OttesenSCG-928-C06]|nr:NAD(P)-dependent oxidoreductase [Desulfovibrio sp. OttesenSCG-928-C06]